MEMSRSKQVVKYGSYVYFSRSLGKSDDFLSVYKKNHKLKGIGAKECFEHYTKALNYQSFLLESLQNMYFEFTEYGGKYDFARYLKDKGVLACNNSFYALMERVFSIREALIYKGHLVRWQKILDAYKEFKKEGE